MASAGRKKAYALGVLVQQRLTECDGFAVVDVRGGSGAGVWSPPETPSSYGVVFVRSGCFRRLSEGVEAVLDPTSVYFEAPGREQRLFTPQADGDRRTTIELAPELLEPLLARRYPRPPSRRRRSSIWSTAGSSRSHTARPRRSRWIRS